MSQRKLLPAGVADATQGRVFLPEENHGFVAGDQLLTEDGREAVVRKSRCPIIRDYVEYCIVNEKTLPEANREVFTKELLEHLREKSGNPSINEGNLMTWVDWQLEGLDEPTEPEGGDSDPNPAAGRGQGLNDDTSAN